LQLLLRRWLWSITASWRLVTATIRACCGLTTT